MLDCWCTDITIILVNTSLWLTSIFIYKSSREYSQVLDNDRLQGLVASMVPGTRWLGPAPCFRPGPGHTAGELPQGRPFPLLRGRSTNGSALLVPVPLGAGFQQEAPGAMGYILSRLPRCFSVGARFGGDSRFASVLRPENGLDHVW